METAALVQALLSPQAYPHRPAQVELEQTQMSLVFLTGPYAYKVKKPVNLGYLDYTTLEKRLFFCQQEVELNRRLCPETYLGVVSITRQEGQLVVEGQGEALEYAVKMLQLPRQRLMDRLLEQDAVSPDMVRRVAERMAQFHRQAATSADIAAFGRRETLRQNTEENFSQMQKYVGLSLSATEYQEIANYTRRFLRRKAALLERRAEKGCIRDCHGDLHTAHVCFSNGLCIYDCIEFNERFRYSDVASEIAFLAMDLDFHRRPDLSRTFCRAYEELSADAEINEVLDFYKCYRACVRGKVESFKLDDPLLSPAEKETALARAQTYFHLAHSYTGKGRRPQLLITVGLVGTGKTALAQALARRLGLALFSSDVVRKELAGIPPTEHRFEEFNRGLYSPQFSRHTYETMFQEAARLLERGQSVILDASFRRQEERRRAQRVARQRGAGFRIIEVVCPPQVVKERLEQRLGQGSASDGRWEVYQAQKEDFDPVKPPHIRVDSSPPLPQVVEEVVRQVERGWRKA